MSPYQVLGPLAAIAAVGGLLLLVAVVRGLPPPKPGRRARVRMSGVTTQRRRQSIQAVLAVVIGLGAWLATGWPVGGLAAAAAVFFLPFFFGVGAVVKRRIDRLDALEEWVRRLADSMGAGGAPVQTIVRSAAHAPKPIREEVTELAERLATPRWDRGVALRRFADQIDDSLGDLIVLALEIAVSMRASDRVPTVLRQMADAAADEVRARRQIEVEQSAPRNEARLVVIIFMAAVIGWVTFTDYTRAYGTPLGQVVLAIIMGIVGTSLWLMRRYSLGNTTPRILTQQDSSAPSQASR